MQLLIAFVFYPQLMITQTKKYRLALFSFVFSISLAASLAFSALVFIILIRSIILMIIS